MAAIVAYDMEPVAPTRRQKKGFPFLANARLLWKNDIRDQFNAGVPSEPTLQRDPFERQRPRGSGLSPHHHAGRTSTRFAPRSPGFRQDYDTDEPVLATRTKSGRRAKVEIVRHDGSAGGQEDI